jgi:hypothetical protein
VTIFQDNVTNSKKMQFQLSGITAATTRTLTIPDTSDTIAVLAFAQTLSNKTITDSTSNVIARALWTGSGAGNVSTFVAAAPTVGQVLTATAGTTATWQSNVSTINGFATTAQTLTTGTAGADFAISSAAGVHTFNLPDASVTNRGVVTTGTQTFIGNKAFNSLLDAVGDFTTHLHVFSTGTTPTIAGVTNVSTVSITGTDTVGVVAFHATAGPTATARVTFGTAIVGATSIYPQITATLNTSMYAFQAFTSGASATSFDITITVGGAADVRVNYYVICTR